MNFIVGNTVMFCSILMLLLLHSDFGIEYVLGTDPAIKSKNPFVNKNRSDTSGAEMVTNVEAKASTVKRSISSQQEAYCGKAGEKRVILCHNGFHAVDFPRCDSLPGPPEDLHVDVNFNKTTEKLSLNVTWKKPVHGTSTLWGFQVLIDSICYQINRKSTTDMHLLVDDSIQFNTEYNTKYEVIVTSLPRNKDIAKYSAKYEVKTQSKCELFHKHGMELPLKCPRCDLIPKQGDNVPFSCRKPNISMEENGCRNGNTRVTWDNPKLNISYLYMVELFNVDDPSFYNWTLINKTQNGTVLSNLEKDAEYEVKVRMSTENAEGESVNSKVWTQRLSCKVPPVAYTTHPYPSTNTTKRLVMYILVTTSFVLIVIGSLSLFKCLKDKQRQKRKGSDSSLLSRESSNNNSDNVPTVMLLYCTGCERVREFVLLLASVLNANGINVFADLLESILIADIGEAAYHEKREEESDFVIIVCTEDADTSSSPCHNAFSFVLNIIRNNVMTGAKKSKYIPIYMDSKIKGNVVPSFLQSVGLKFPDSFENILQRMHGVRPYELRNIAAVKNALPIDQTTLNPLKSCISRILQHTHQECVSGRCSKGLKSSSVSVIQIDQISMDCSSLQSRPLSETEVSEFSASQSDMYEPDDDSSSFEFQPGMDNGLLKVDSCISVV